MGDFGNALPQVQPTQLPQSNINELAGALGNVANAANQEAVRQREEKIKQDNLTASSIVSQFGLDAENISSDYRQKVASGQMSDTDADLEFSKQYGMKVDEVVAQLPKSVAQNYKQNLMQYAVSQVGTFYQTGRKTAAETAITNLKLTINNAAKMGDSQTADALVAGAFNSARDFLSPSDHLELTTNYKQQQQTNNIGYRLAAASTIEDFQGIYNDLQDENKYVNVQGTTRNSALHSAQSGIIRIQKQEAQAQAKKESEATKLTNNFQNNVLSGGAISLDYISNTETAVKGTAAESDFNFWKENYTGIQKFMSLNTNDQKLQLNQMQQQFKTDGADNASDRKKLLDVYQRVYNQTSQAARNDNVAAAANVGVEVKPIIGKQLISNPQVTVQSIIDNAFALHEAKKKEPNINLDPIPNQNKLDIQQSFSQANAKQQLNVLAAIMKGTQSHGMPLSAANGIIKSIGGGDGYYNVAAVAVANNAIYNGKNTGYIILSGANSLKSASQITPKSLIDEYRSKVSNLANDGDFNANWTAFKSAYAFFESEAGHTQKNKDDAFNDDSFQKALDATTGGLYQQHTTAWIGSGNFKTSNGVVSNWQIQKPYLMSDHGFETAMNSGMQQIANRTGVSLDFIKDNYRLQARPGSTYDRNVVYDLLDADGKRWNVKGKTQMIIITNKRR